MTRVIVAACVLLLVPGSVMAADPPPFRFTAVQAPPMGVDGGISAGVAAGDVDGDGWTDIYIANWGAAPNRLYLIREGRSIVRGDFGVATGELDGSSGPLLCDFDNDGHPDLFVARQGNRHNALFMNRDGDLMPVTTGDAVSDFGDSYSATCGDIDNDGDLDLVVGNSGQPVYMYRNDGTGRFDRVDDFVQAGAAFGAWAPVMTDLDGNGALDILVPATTNLPDGLFTGDGDGGFTSVNGRLPDTDASPSLAYALGDIDNDGDLDLLVAKYNGFFVDAHHRLYRNDDGVFVAVDDSPLSGSGQLVTGASFMDIDNDGDLDVYVARYGERDQLFVNDGTGEFTEARRPTLFAFAYFSGGHAWHDFDRDGRQDLAVSNWEGMNNFIFWNATDGGNWLQIELEGTDSNRPGIGAKVWAEADIDGCKVRQRRDIVAAHSFRSQSPPEAAFGFGSTKTVDRIRVEWPSGTVTELEGVEAGHRLRIREDGVVTRLWSAAEPVESLVDRVGERFLDASPDVLGDLIEDAGDPGQADFRALVLFAARAGKASHSIAASDRMLLAEPESASAWRLRLAIIDHFGLHDERGRTMARLAEVADHLQGDPGEIKSLQNDVGYWRKFDSPVGEGGR